MLPMPALRQKVSPARIRESTPCREHTESGPQIPLPPGEGGESADRRTRRVRVLQLLFNDSTETSTFPQDQYSGPPWPLQSPPAFRPTLAARRGQPRKDQD